MNENNFDRYIKENLADYKSEVPAGLWDKIEKGNTKKRVIPFIKTPRFLLGILILSAISIASFGIYYFNTISKNIDNAVLNKETIENNNLTKSKNPPTASLQNDLETTNKPSTKLTTISNEPIASKADSLSDNSYAKNNTIKEPTTITNPTITKDNIDIKETKVASVKHLDKSLKAANKPNIQISNNEKIALEKSINSNLFGNRVVLNKNKLSDTKGLNSISGNNILESNPQSSSVINHDNLSYHDGLGEIKSNNNRLVSNFKINKNLEASNKNITHIVSNKPSISNWYVEAYGSVDNNNRDLKKTGNLTTSFLNSIRNTQKIQTGVSVGLKVSKELNKHFLLKVGAQYKQVNERFRYIKQGDVKNVSVVNVRSYVDGNGITIYVNDTSNLQQIGYSIKTTFNTYKSIELPVGISYETSIGKKLKCAINSGFIFNLSTFYEGQTFDTTNNPIQLSAKKSDGNFKSSLGIDLYGGLSMYYPLTHNVQALIEPYYRQSLNYNNISSQGYAQKFNAFGVAFGIRYSISSSSNKHR